MNRPNAARPVRKQPAPRRPDPERAARELGVALIGQRFMGRAHANAWRQAAAFFDLPRAPVLRVVAGRDGAALPAFATRWGSAGWTTRWQQAVDAADVDLVDLVTPNHLHAAPALAALAAGKHVACEKPLAATLAEARALRDEAARRRRQHTFVWFNYRRCPAIGLAYQLVREGRLGRLHHLRCTYLQSWGGPDTPRTWRFQKRRAGSGAHGDLNAHLVDLARFLSGEEIVEVHGALARTFVRTRPDPDTGRAAPSSVDDCLLFLATLAGGATASFEASRVATGHHNANTIELNGTRGALRFAFEDMNHLHFHDAADGARTAGWRSILCTSAAGAHPYLSAWWPDGHLIGYEHGFANMAADIVRVLGGQEPELPLPDFEDGYQTQRVLEAALLAARERRPVRLAEVR